MTCEYCGQEWVRRWQPGEPLTPPFPCYNCTLDRLSETIDDLNGEIDEWSDYEQERP